MKTISILLTTHLFLSITLAASIDGQSVNGGMYTYNNSVSLPIPLSIENNSSQNNMNNIPNKKDVESIAASKPSSDDDDDAVSQFQMPFLILDKSLEQLQHTIQREISHNQPSQIETSEMEGKSNKNLDEHNNSTQHQFILQIQGPNQKQLAVQTQHASNQNIKPKRVQTQIQYAQQIYQPISGTNESKESSNIYQEQFQKPISTSETHQKIENEKNEIHKNEQTQTNIENKTIKTVGHQLSHNSQQPGPLPMIPVLGPDVDGMNPPPHQMNASPVGQPPSHNSQQPGPLPMIPVLGPDVDGMNPPPHQMNASPVGQPPSHNSQQPGPLPMIPVLGPDVDGMNPPPHQMNASPVGQPPSHNSQQPGPLPMIQGESCE
uniref:Uncharacterized protein n=1 Tax=Trichobilharzia regenti TaxID=157069 RepID=A0AA85JCE0_TRIRE|nr:unnamed protein product [Trichobilharzia regenti]